MEQLEMIIDERKLELIILAIEKWDQPTIEEDY
jgi:hypothetical protein